MHGARACPRRVADLSSIAPASDRYLTARLLLPSKAQHDDRVYQLRDKTMLAVRRHPLLARAPRAPCAPARFTHLHAFGAWQCACSQHLSTILRCSEVAMNTHLETSSDVGLTAEHFAATVAAKRAQRAPLAAGACGDDGHGGGAAGHQSLTLAEVSQWLDRLAQPGASPLSLFGELVPRCVPSELRVVMRIVRKVSTNGLGRL